MVRVDGARSQHSCRFRRRGLEVLPEPSLMPGSPWSGSRQRITCRFQGPDPGVPADRTPHYAIGCRQTPTNCLRISDMSPVLASMPKPIPEQRNARQMIALIGRGSPFPSRGKRDSCSGISNRSAGDSDFLSRLSCRSDAKLTALSRFFLLLLDFTKLSFFGTKIAEPCPRCTTSQNNGVLRRKTICWQ